MLWVVFVGNNADIYYLCWFLPPSGKAAELQLKQTKEATCLCTM